VSSSASRVWMTTGRPARAPRELRAKDGLLHLARREIVVVVEANLPHRAHAGHGVEPAREQASGFERIGREQLRLVRVHADGGANLRPQRLDAGPAGQLGVVFGGEDDERGLDASGTGTRHHFGQVGHEGVASNVTVGIDHGTTTTTSFEASPAPWLLNGTMRT
jgi:hypothetical protein